MAAAEKCLKTAKFFPRPAEILEAVKDAQPSLMKPGRWSCAMCGNQLSYPTSLERGYCGPCWRQIDVKGEDKRLEYNEPSVRERVTGPDKLGEIEWRPDR